MVPDREHNRAMHDATAGAIEFATQRDEYKARLSVATEALRWYAEETEHDDCCNDYGRRATEALARIDREDSTEGD